MTDVFNNILLNDEQIIKTYKPIKSVFVLRALFMLLPLILFFSIPFIPIGIVSSKMPTPLIIYSIVGPTIYLILFVFTVCFAVISYKNRFYAVTNKRLIIRHGVIGVDYQMLDLHCITNLNVYVSVIDKIVKKNSGSIRFSASSIPSVTGQLGFLFQSIKAPYEVYKEIKEIIDGAH